MDREIHGTSNVWSKSHIQVKSCVLIQMFVLDDAMDQLSILDSLDCCWHVLITNNGRVHGQVLEFGVDGQRWNVRLDSI